MSSQTPPNSFQFLRQPRARSGIGTYLNLLVACTALAAAAVSGALVLLGTPKVEGKKANASEPKPDPGASR